MRERLLGLIAVALLADCSGVSHGGEALASAKVGAPAPAFSEPRVDGGTLALSSYKGKAVYLNFFATWCPPCNEEAPDVRAVADEFKSQGLQVIGVDVAENQKKAKQFVDQHHLTYPAIVDQGELQEAYHINGMPVHVFISRDGTLKKIFVGELSKDEMIANVKFIL